MCFQGGFGIDKNTNLDAAERALLKLATGFRYSETTHELKQEGSEKKLMVTKKVTKYVPPDFRALSFLLQGSGAKGGAGRLSRPFKDVESEKLRELLECEPDE